MLHIYDRIRTMQMIATAVARGRIHHVSGHVHMDKAETLATKLMEKYGANADPSRQRAQLRAGQARSTLVLLASPAELQFAWWLLVTDGAGAVANQEKLADARRRDTRIDVAGFELVRMPAKNGEDKARWTWRLPSRRYEELMAHATALATHTAKDQAQALVEVMKAWPGFRGVSVQRREIWRAMAAARQRAGQESLLEIPSATPWPGRLEMRGHGTPLAIAVERMRQQVRMGDTQ